VNDPITINSYGDYERIFGGLWVESSMSHAVRDFYLNGGSQAIIVRLDREATEATITMSLPLVAANVGSWGNNLSVEVDYDTKDPTNDKLFNLTVSEAGGSTEKFLNVYTDPNNPRYIPRVLEQSSALVRVAKDDDGIGSCQNDLQRLQPQQHQIAVMTGRYSQLSNLWEVPKQESTL
jgi:hypothetical protein